MILKRLWWTPLPTGLCNALILTTTGSLLFAAPKLSCSMPKPASDRATSPLASHWRKPIRWTAFHLQPFTSLIRQPMGPSSARGLVYYPLRGAAIGDRFTYYGVSSDGRTNAIGSVLIRFGGACVAANDPGPISSMWSAENNAADSFGTNHGTLHGGVTFSPGRVGQAFNFNGIDGLVDVGAHGVYPPWAVAFWVNRQASSGFSSTVLFDPIGGGIFIEPDGRIGAGVPFGGYTLPANTWVHVGMMATRPPEATRPAEARLYINGSLVSTLPYDFVLGCKLIGGGALRADPLKECWTS
jgi:hypothetical protein